jgi:hypothetical protein
VIAVQEALNRGDAFLNCLCEDTATVTLATPASGGHGALTEVVVAGTGFRPGGLLIFGTLFAFDIKWYSKLLMTCTAPPQAAGAVDVFYKDSRGTVRGASLYTYT